MAERGLDADTVTAAARALLDEVGLRGFTMRKLADRLGTYPATIYWHVGGRDDVLARVLSGLLHEMLAGLPDAETTPWDEWLVASAHAYRDLIRAHPAFGEISVTRLTPEVLAPRVLETWIGVLARAGFRGAALVGAYNTWIGSLGGWAAMEQIDGGAAGGPDAAAMEESVRGLSAHDYPTIAANLDHLADQAFTLRWHGGADRPLDDAFAFAVRTWIAGLRAQLDGGSSATGDRGG